MGIGMGMANEMSRAYSQTNTSQATPPPLPQEPPIYVAVNGEKTGPFDLATVELKIQSGEIGRNTLIWQEPMPEWAAAEKVEKLAALFPKMPPPLPNISSS